jgi:pyrimidine operon attenuation protein/uracil phosphoribosyltransferase
LCLINNAFIATMAKKTLLNEKEIHIILHRLACQLIENHQDFSDTILIGIQPRGIYLANRLVKLLQEEYGIKNIQMGKLDITFYRDDFRRREEPLQASNTEINFVVDSKNVVFIDDVLFSGRSIRAALTAIQAFGRPNNIELLVLIDRRFSRHLPIQPDYLGRQVDVIKDEQVKVGWKENDKKDVVYIINSDKN